MHGVTIVIVRPVLDCSRLPHRIWRVMQFFDSTLPLLKDARGLAGRFI
jgi:hypothetical protein